MTSPRFSVGQRVRVVSVGKGREPYLGMECTLTAYLGNDYYRTDMVGSTSLFGLFKRYWKGPSKCFAPLRDPPEPGSWSELADIWKPEGVRA